MQYNESGRTGHNTRQARGASAPSSAKSPPRRNTAHRAQSSGNTQRVNYGQPSVNRDGQRRAPQNMSADTATQKIDLRKLKRRFILTGSLDVPFIIIVLALLTIGVLMMFSASYTASYYKNDGDAFWFVKKQALFAVAGVIIMLIVSKIDYRIYNSGLTFLAVAVTFILLIVVLFMPARDGFRRWIYIGPASFQPSEVAKFTLILLLAFIISRTQKYMRSNGKICFRAMLDQNLGPVWNNNENGVIRQNFALTVLYAMIILIYAAFILLEKHLSCTVLILLIGMSMMWLGGVRRKWFILVGVLVAVVVVTIYLKPDILPEYATERIVAWTDKSYSPQDKRWQINQSLNAIASGGPFGLGFGNSRQKNLYVSEPQNDFIFAIVTEELGFVGATAIILLFAALVYRGAKIATNTKDVFGALLCMGIVLQIGIQTALNIMVVTDTMPNTGISLPFFSYGGTSLVMLLAETGVVLSVSRRSNINR